MQAYGKTRSRIKQQETPAAQVWLARVFYAIAIGCACITTLVVLIFIFLFGSLAWAGVLFSIGSVITALAFWAGDSIRKGRFLSLKDTTTGR